MTLCPLVLCPTPKPQNPVLGTPCWKNTYHFNSSQEPSHLHVAFVESQVFHSSPNSWCAFLNLNS
jgi:hypothetical protein